MNVYMIIVLVCFINIVSCRDFYVGMFKKNDWLVAQDRLYKEKVPYKHMYAKYGRIFKCKITYFRVADRLGYGPGPKVQIIRGGLNHKYLVLRLTSPYNMPVSVNIYVGCANNFRTTKANTSTSRGEVERTDNITANTKADDHRADELKTTQAGCTTNCTDTNQTTVGQPAGTTVALTTA